MKTKNSTAEGYFHSGRYIHMYKQQAKHYLFLKSPVHILRYCELEIPVAINSTCLLNTINNILMVCTATISMLRDSEDRSFNV